MATMLIAMSLGIGVGTTPLAWAEDHALLVGVSDYPNLPKRLWLRGPVNDVQLMQGLLRERGFADANVLSLTSRHVDSGGAPTRANILAAMTVLQGKVGANDRVVLYLSGHGSQQPQIGDHANRPTEANGYDEVFLPADVRRWDGERSEATIANALLDDEIGEWMDRLVDKGAKVFAIFDTCHAAGMARGGAPLAGARYRSVVTVDLGLPALPEAARPVRRRVDGRTLAFAARSHELTAEEWLPKGAPMGANRMQGVFTYHLVQSWRRRAAPSGAALEQDIAQAYRVEGRSSPTPLVQGSRDSVWP